MNVKNIRYSPVTIVLILDGSSEHVARTRRKNGLFKEKTDIALAEKTNKIRLYKWFKSVN